MSVQAVLRRLDTATPAHRDRTIDALRAVAILGVVLGHWMVSALVSDPARPTAWVGASPLTDRPAFAAATWFLQTLGPFFFAAGYAAALGRRHRPALPWLASRVARLAKPVLALAAVWLPALLLLRVAGAPDSTQHVVKSLVTHPMWFLLVYLVLLALTPLLRPWTVLPLIAVVALSDVTGSAWLGALAVPAGWAVPYVLGMALAGRKLPDRAGAVLLPLGVAAAVTLVAVAGYPASAVGVPGDGRSNLSPPSLFAIALAAAQIGAFLLARSWLARVLRRPVVWAPVAVLNLAALTVFCWHQTALLLVSFAGLTAGRLPGLLDAPAGVWPLHRLMWLPVFAAVLVVLCALFHRFERTGGRFGVLRTGEVGSTPFHRQEESPMTEHEVNRSAVDGQFVTDETVENDPRTTTTEQVGGGDSDREVNRRSSTGKFVKDSTVERHPDTTETQQV